MGAFFKRVGLALAAALWMGLTGPLAQAASYDPELTWRTLQTEHFNITFHGGEEALAQEVGDLSERIWADLTVELAWDPRRRTEIVLVDNTDSANGYAMTTPVNTIVIYVTAPTEDSTLGTYEDWNDAILTHEYVHILHLDTIEGLPKLLRGILGRIISVNRVSPGWMVEGQATLQETWHTGGGRGRSNVAHMIKRAAVLEDAFPPLGNMDGWQRELPAGNLRYLFGQDFQQYVAEKTGRNVWTDFFHTYGGWVPYWLPTKRVFGQGLLSLYREWKRDMEGRYGAQKARVEAQGLTEFRLLSDGEDRCAGPTFSPDGAQIVWACSDPRVGSDVYLAKGDGADPEVELEQRYASDFTWRRDSKAFAFSALHVVDRFNLYSDVYLHNVGGGLDTLTSGKRARHPTFSPDGTELLVVTNGLQKNQLARLTVDRVMDTVAEWGDDTQLSTPTFSPDGRHLALSLWRDGKRDIWVFARDGSPVRRVTADGAHDLDPAWSADGKTLFFSSDRSQIFNIYAVDLETERLWQVTNVLGGAFHPSVSPDGQRMVFESFSNNGVDIAMMDLDRSAWWDRGLLPSTPDAPLPLAQVLPSSPIELPAPPEDTGDAADEGKKGKKKSKSAQKSPAVKKLRLDGRRTHDPLMTDGAPVRGLDGLGGPLHTLGKQEGPWGRPGDGPTARPHLGDAPEAGPDADDPENTDNAVPEEQDFAFTYPVSRYNPWPTLLPPRYISPRLYQTSYGFMGVLSTSGVDLLRRWAYSGYLSYRTDSQYLGWGGSIMLNRWIPVYSAGVYSYTVPYGDIFTVDQPPAGGGAWVPGVSSTNERYWDKRLRAYAQVSWSLSSYRSVFAGWNGTLRQPLDPIGPDVYRPLLPDRGFISKVGGGWRYAKGQFYDRSISAEDARIVSVVAGFSHPLIGSYTLDDLDQPQGFTQLQLTGEWREYRTLPWWNNHVLAGKLALGAAGGDAQRYGNYRLGGSYGESAYYTLPDEWRSLRGFPPATVYGDWFYLGSLEYRLPLWNIDRGVGLVPVFARNLHLAAFVDAGNAFDGFEDEAPVFRQTLVGAGGELRGSAIIGWGIPLTFRLGYSFALRGDNGYQIGSLGGAYAWLGSSF